MATNECGDEVPNDIIAKAMKRGSINCPLYVYKDGQYGNKLPASSIGGEKAHRIRNANVLHKRKIELGDGWVVFESAGGQNTGLHLRRTEGKGKCEPCVICNEDRFTDGAHFPTPDRKGGTEMISLCPTHHKLLDNGRLSIAELKTIWKNKYPSFKTFIEFMEWANGKQYSYTIQDIRNKKVWEDYDEKEIHYKISNNEG